MIGLSFIFACSNPTTKHSHMPFTYLHLVLHCGLVLILP